MAATAELQLAESILAPEHRKQLCCGLQPLAMRPSGLCLDVGILVFGALDDAKVVVVERLAYEENPE